MFRKSKNKQRDLFKGITNSVSNRKQKMLDDPVSWHNVFYKELICRIDESIFSVLYSADQGRPNASIRVLVGMMILKEGQGWSDEQLFEECRFNLKVMQALGLMHMDDDIPVEATYYEFKRLLGEHYEMEGQDLLKALFKHITIQQVAVQGVKGRKIRLDSKLINSNIAKSNRLHLIVEGLRRFVKDLDSCELAKEMKEEWCAFIEKLQHKSTVNVTYSLTSAEKKDLLEALGYMIKSLLSIYKNNQPPYYTALKQIYAEQYEEVAHQEDDQEKGQGQADRGLVKLRTSTQIRSSSIQSVHDTQATYRSKGVGAQKQTVVGYHANITESCSEDDEVHLILDAEVKQANVSEAEFLVPSVEQCEHLLSQTRSHNGEGGCIEEAITDGGYDSVANRTEMVKADKPKWSLSKFKGTKPVYCMQYDQDGTLQVWDQKSGEPCAVRFSQKVNKYVITSSGRQKRYFTPEQIDNYIRAQQIEAQVTKESRNLRANVESTIHQVFHRLKNNNKIVYRGLYKCQCYVLSRVFWVNITRITKKMTEKAIYIFILIFSKLTVSLRRSYCIIFN